MTERLKSLFYALREFPDEFGDREILIGCGDRDIYDELVDAGGATHATVYSGSPQGLPDPHVIEIVRLSRDGSCLRAQISRPPTAVELASLDGGDVTRHLDEFTSADVAP